LVRKARGRGGGPKFKFDDEGHGSDYPTYLAVVTDDASKQARVAEVSKDGLGQKALNDDVVRVATLTELQDPNSKLLSQYPWQAGRVYRRHEDPANPTYFLVEKWDVTMKRLCSATVVNFLINLGLRLRSVSETQKTKGQKTLKARLFGGGGGVDAGLEGSNVRAASTATSLTSTQMYTPPTHPPFIDQDQDMFWVQNPDRCIIPTEGRTLFELGQAFVEAGQPTVKSVDLKITFASRNKTMREFAANFKALFGVGGAGGDWEKVHKEERTVELHLEFHPLEDFVIAGDLPLVDTIDTVRKPAEIKANCGKYLNRQAKESWIFILYSFNIACVGPIRAGKSSLIHSANVALNQLVGYKNPINTGEALLGQGLRVRGVGSDEKPSDGTKTDTYDLYKMLDCRFKAGRSCRKYKGELRFMDTAGMPVTEAGAVQWKERVLQDEPGVRSSMKAQLMDVAIPDVTLLVFDAKDLFERIGETPSAEEFMTQYKPLIDEIRTVLPGHPFLVVLTKIDELDRLMDTQDGTLEGAKAQLEKEVRAVFPDSADIVCVTNYTIPTTDDMDTFAKLESGATTTGQSRKDYLNQVAEWTEMNNEHLDLMFLATNAARDIKEKLRASADKTCTVM